MISLLQNFQTPPPPPMAPTLFELKLKITSAKELNNVNRRHGSLKPSVSAWVEPAAKFSTKVDHDGDTSPSWNETLQIPVPSSIDDSALYLEIVHDKSDGEEDTEPIVGSAHLSLRDVVDDVGFGVEAFRTLDLRPQGKVDVEISVKDSQDLLHRASDQYHAAPYSMTSPAYHEFRPARYGAYSHAPSVNAYQFQKPTNGQEGPYEQLEADAKVVDVGAVTGALEDNIANKLDLTRASDRYYAAPYSMISPDDNELQHVRYSAYAYKEPTDEQEGSYAPIGAKADDECIIEKEKTLSNMSVFARALPDGSDLSKENIVKKLANIELDEEDD